MLSAPASDRYRIVMDDPEPAKRWFRSIGVLIANVASWFDGLTSGPTNPATKWL